MIEIVLIIGLIILAHRLRCATRQPHTIRLDVHVFARPRPRRADAGERKTHMCGIRSTARRRQRRATPAKAGCLKGGLSLSPFFYLCHPYCRVSKAVLAACASKGEMSFARSSSEIT